MPIFANILVIPFLIFVGVLLYHDTWIYYDRKCEKNRIERIQCLKSFVKTYFPNNIAYICYLPYTDISILKNNNKGVLENRIQNLNYIHYINENVLDLNLFFKPISVNDLIDNFFYIDENKSSSDFLTNQQNIIFEQNTCLDLHYRYRDNIFVTNKADFDLNENNIIFKGRSLKIGANFRLDRDEYTFPTSTISGIRIPSYSMCFEILPYLNNSQNILSNYRLDNSYLYSQTVMPPY